MLRNNARTHQINCRGSKRIQTTHRRDKACFVSIIDLSIIKYVNNENIKLTYKNKPISEIADPKIDRNKYKTEINAQEFMDLISNNAWSTGDPAFIFFDKVNIAVKFAYNIF